MIAEYTYQPNYMHLLIQDAHRPKTKTKTTGAMKMDAIMEIICNYFQVTPEYIRKKKRNRDIVAIRQILMYFLRQKTFSTLDEIGLFCSEDKEFPFDHTTVSHSTTTVLNLIETNDEYRQDILDIQNKIK